MKFIPGNLLSRRAGANPTTVVLYAGLILFVVLALANFLLSATRATQTQQNIIHVAEMQVLSQQMANHAVAAASGNQRAFLSLATARTRFQSTWDQLKPALADQPKAQAALQRNWDHIGGNIDTVIGGRDTVLKMRDVARDQARAGQQIQEQYEGVTQALIGAGASARQVAFAERQSLLVERTLHALDHVISGDSEAVNAATDYATDSKRFGLVLKGMLQGDLHLGVTRVTHRSIRKQLEDVDARYDDLAGAVQTVIDGAPEMVKVRGAADAIVSTSRNTLKQADELTRGFQAGTAKPLPSVWAGVLFSAIAAVLLVLILLQRSRNSLRRQAELESRNQRNQAAILRLLDEMGDLADGDLTVEATVTEDFTGAIADSINYSIDQLRSLVTTINSSAVQVASATQDSQSTAAHLAEASEHQAQEIAGASAAVTDMAVSIDQVSANATESATVAKQAVTIANKGAAVVQATIHGMDNIRGQIQETSKRIKRLGESSQEIGDIVGLINDIADQTNILALNAAIQASMAGEAGRGFAVVADEVQRLAERSAGATKQIETLVKTIQADTNEAVISMETTTTEVVSGAQLAQEAGVALGEIEDVSKTLADLIQSISSSARQQATSAGHISNTMNVIQEITSQTSAGTTATAQSIGNLTEMAQDMRESVAGFRLPESS